MLRGRAALVLGGLVLALLAPTQSAVADGPSGGVACTPRKLDCDVSVEVPGKPAGTKPGKPTSGGGGGGGKPTCALGDEPVPCTSHLGQFNAADACYWRLKDPQPKTRAEAEFTSGLPEDWKPGDPGKFYDVTCPGAERQLMGGSTFSETGPDGGGVDVRALADQAVEALRLEGADIGIAPKPDGVGLVGMPVWIWNRPGETHTGPASASASAGGVTVTAKARVRNVTYRMGDGGEPVVCTAPGTPYSKEFGMRVSPDCGYRYERPSATVDGGRYKIAAVTTWDIDWEGAGQSGTLTTTRNASTSVEIREAQVLNTR